MHKFEVGKAYSGLVDNFVVLDRTEDTIRALSYSYKEFGKEHTIDTYRVEVNEESEFIMLHQFPAFAFHRCLPDDMKIKKQGLVPFAEWARTKAEKMRANADELERSIEQMLCREEFMHKFEIGKVYESLNNNVLIVDRTESEVRALVYRKFGEDFTLDFYPIMQSQTSGEYIELPTYSAYACNGNRKDTDRVAKEGIVPFAEWADRKADELREEATARALQAEELRSRGRHE